MKMYEVGGCVRDSLLGVSSKDIDFTVVLPSGSYRDPFRFMVEELEKMGFEIFKEKPEFFTARARFPRRRSNESVRMSQAHIERYEGMTADFVLARKESGYSDGRRPDYVRLGTLEDDLARRDFTVNAIAKDPATGDLIDPFGGVADVEGRYLRAVGEPLDRLSEDPLRAVRALRFAVTKGFEIDPALAFAMETRVVLDGVERTADERIDEELRKLLNHPGGSLELLRLYDHFPHLMQVMLSGGVRLTSTMKEGRRR
jgi:tRNA nucleotidyltransferase/poly(A) polymerase